MAELFQYRISQIEEPHIARCQPEEGPVAKVRFAPSALGMPILLVMLFHQIQLRGCATLAHRRADRVT
jgi:hypothetical protein